MSEINKIYFFDDGYGARGGANLFFEIITYLLENYKIEIGLIDLEDGYLREKLINRDIDFVDETENLWNLEANSVVFVPVERLCLLKELQSKIIEDSIKIVTILWETEIGWHILYPNYIRDKYFKLLRDEKALFFMDLGCHYAMEEQSKVRFQYRFFPNYLPYNNNVCADKNVVSKNVINLGWVGRLSDSKCFALLNVIRQLKNYQTEKTIVLHIIGYGLYEEQFKNHIEALNLSNIQIHFVGRLVDNALDEYLVKNVDILFAMGTSMLNGARLHLPTVGVSETLNSILNLDRFIWLYDEADYQLGLSDTESKVKKINNKAMPIKNILDEIYIHNNKQVVGDRCFEYYIKKHSNIAKNCDLLLKYINESTLTYGKIRKLFKILPYIKLLTNEYYAFGIPFYRVINNETKTDYYIFGFRMLKKYDTPWYMKYYLFGIPIYTAKAFNDRTKINFYILGCRVMKKYDTWLGCKYYLFGFIKLFEIAKTGRYSFPNIFNKALK